MSSARTRLTPDEYTPNRRVYIRDLDVYGFITEDRSVIVCEYPLTGRREPITLALELYAADPSEIRTDAATRANRAKTWPMPLSVALNTILITSEDQDALVAAIIIANDIIGRAGIRVQIPDGRPLEPHDALRAVIVKEVLLHRFDDGIPPGSPT